MEKKFLVIYFQFTMSDKNINKSSKSKAKYLFRSKVCNHSLWILGLAASKSLSNSLAILASCSERNRRKKK